ncbi:MAG: hypothetical protein D6B25_17125, partial [Desulfobulbaceae bacterium]
MVVIKFIAVFLLILVLLPAYGYTRSGTFSAGLSLSLDIDERSYDSSGESNEASVDGDDYRKFLLTPLLQYVTKSERDRFELRAQPSIKYDFEDEKTDWDSDFSFSAMRELSRYWTISGYNRYLQSDHYENRSTEKTTQALSSPNLNADPGRRRYIQNSLNLATDYIYQEGSLVKLSFDWDVLRNDDDDDGYEDYDRSAISLRDEHRFTKKWRTVADLSYVLGEYDEFDFDTADARKGSSSDLQEYYILLRLENNSIEHNPLSMSYRYTGVNYEDNDRGDDLIHELQLSWRNDITPHLYTVIGAGPSYKQTRGSDENWGGNGVAELSYRLQHGLLHFRLDKGYKADNFSGTDERGVIDTWAATLKLSYQLSRALTLDSKLVYNYEDREGVSGSNELTADLLPGNTKQRYSSEAGIGFKLFQHQSVRLSYT